MTHPDPETASASPSPAAALKYATEQEQKQNNSARLHKWSFFFFQGLTVVAAAAATVMAVADTKDIAPEYRAIPAAIATLGASVLAAGQFRAGWQRHRSARRRLEFEILKYQNKFLEYGPTEPSPEAVGVNLFLQRVHAITRAAEEAAVDPNRSAEEETEQERTPGNGAEDDAAIGPLDTDSESGPGEGGPSQGPRI